MIWSLCLHLSSDDHYSYGSRVVENSVIFLMLLLSQKLVYSPSQFFRKSVYHVETVCSSV
jgi:hypothetical protein